MGANVLPPTTPHHTRTETIQTTDNTPAIVAHYFFNITNLTAEYMPTEKTLDTENKH